MRVGYDLSSLISSYDCKDIQDDPRKELRLKYRVINFVVGLQHE